MIRDLVVQLVSPAMIGGAVKGTCDEPPSLRPPSIRGHLRFWTRALGGDELEKRLWGTEDTGQRVRLILARSIARGGRLTAPRRATLIPSRHYKTDMIPPGDQVFLRFALADRALLPELEAVVWVWLHLGAVGRRSRRGYGSLLWLPSEGDLLADWPPLWPSHHLQSREALEEYLRAGFRCVSERLGVPDEGSRVEASDGRLRTRDQIFVGKELVVEWEVAGGRADPGQESLEQAVHGLNERGRGSEPDRTQLGSGDPRLPSPMIWRVFPIAEAQGYRAVLTWFPQGYDEDVTPRVASSQLYGYLNGSLGFEKSLTGGELAEPGMAAALNE